MGADVRMDWSGATFSFDGLLFFTYERAFEMKYTKSSAILGQYNLFLYEPQGTINT